MIGLAEPGWLWALLPWAAVAAYLTATAGRAVGVPFLALWAGEAGVSRRAVRVRRRPPLWVLAVLVGMLAAIVGAAGPTRGGATAAVAVVVLDRGVTMAGPAGGPPFRGAIDRAASLLAGRPATLVMVPPVGGGGETTGVGWAAAARAAGPTGVDTAGAVAAAVGQLARSVGTGPIFVLTDHDLPADPRVVRVGPTVGIGGVGIVRLTARDRPRPQVMVRLVNRTGSPTVRVAVTSGAAAGGTTVTTAGATTADGFVDLPALGSTVSATAEAGTEGVATVDGRAWLAAGAASPRVVATPGVPAAVARMAAVFDATEGMADGPVVVVTDRPLGADQAGVWVVPSTAGSGVATVAEDDLTAGVTQWAGGGAAVPGGFTVVVTVGGRPAVAVRGLGAGRSAQVWANVDVDGWSRTADWVVFLANAFRRAGGGRTAYTAETPHRLGADWHRLAGGPAPAGAAVGEWPGLFQSDDGRLIAINAAGRPGAAVTMPTAAVATPPPAGGSAAAVVVALALVSAATAAWPRVSALGTRSRESSRA